MIRRAVVALATLAITAGVAAAAPRKVMVLRADGKLEAATRTRIDAAVLALARELDGEISPGDITFADAAAAVGCSGDVAACGDQVLEVLSIDELIAVTVEAAPGGEVMITVERVSKASKREMTGRVPAASPEPALTEAVGSLFGAAGKPATTTTGKPAPAITTTPAPSTTETSGPDALPSDFDPYPPAETAPPEPTVTAAPTSVVTPAPEGGRRTRRLAIAGLAGGGVLMVIGVVLWNAAAGKQAEIDDAPTRTRDDLLHLQDLESSADSYALWGNVTFFAGVAAAGAGGFLLWRGRSVSSSSSARLVPIAIGDGGGLAVTIGAEP